MLRRIIKIDREKCNGCGKCADACHEGAIAMVDGKARLVRDDYCDGLGDCLPACPMSAISLEERKVLPYDATVSVKSYPEAVCRGACPGTSAKTQGRGNSHSRLMQWPCQIKLVPTNAPYFDGANLLIAADCTAFA